MTKNYNALKISLLVLLVSFVQQFQAQTVTVNSLQELLPYLKQNNVDVKLAPGDYSISGLDITLGKYSNPLFLFEGSDSTYDFTDVKIEISTLVFTRFGNVDVNEIQILGNNNVLKNLTIEDVGTTAPTKRAQAIVMDGRDNRIEGFHLTVRGSYPYGYGDAFGKGGGAVIAHRKHSGILIRGLRNHLKNTTVISRSYGHCVFMQAASYPKIEGCYIEGEMRTTDDMLAEAGTGSPADNVNFMTVWGYRLPPGYMMSLQEAGIRAYNAGTTYIDGVEIERGTDNPTVLNCTIKNARTGVVLTHATGTKYVEGCNVYGSEKGFSIGSGVVLDCGADVIYGPILKTDYSSDSNDYGDFTILQPSDAYYNGHKAVAYIGGRDHDINFKSDIVDFPSDLKIMVSGDLQNLRLLNGNSANQNNLTSSNISLRNLTNFPVVLHSDSSDILLRECDTQDVTNNGTNNTVATIDCDSENFALTGVAIQSSTDYGGIASRAIDGNTSGNYGNGSVTHSDPSETGTWFLLRLKEEKILNNIVIFNRTGNTNYINRLANFQVKVYDASGKETFTQTFTNNPPNPSKTINAGGVKGETIKIFQLNDSVALSLAEVQVFGASLSIIDKNSTSISLFPNPVNNQLHVSLKLANINIESTNIEMYNLNGQKVLTKKLLNSKEVILDLSGFNKGVYLLKISDEQTTVTKKVIKI